MELTKVACLLCGGVFKVEEPPPIEVVEPSFTTEGHPVGAYTASSTELTDDAAARAYCRETCPWCKDDSAENANR
jgi:hypothetical protein